MPENELSIDLNEPHEMHSMLKPTINQTNFRQLNVDGWADYRWQGFDTKYTHVERKTWGELLGNPDRVEEQLYRHLTKQPQARLVFMLEGIITQGEIGTHELKPTASGVWVKSRQRSMTRLSRVYSLLYQFSEYMQVVQTSSLIESAVMISCMYKSDQKDKHETFNRHIKQVSFNTDPRITTLMGAAIGLGDKRATDIIQSCGTPWNFFSAGFYGTPAINSWKELTQIEGIGETTVRNVLRSFGRPDV